MYKNIFNSLTLKQKLFQMFIMGFSGLKIGFDNENIKKAIEMGLGGVIFFAKNIYSDDQVKDLTAKFNMYANIPLFISIDQEGGLVERTIFKKEKIDYLSPMALATTKNLDDIKLHTEIMAKELNYLGFNMNFAPVLDVNTNRKNPIIGVRAFSSNTDEVVKYSQIVYKTLSSYNILPVGKHFPGHGEAWIDSHLDMPEIDISFEKLEKIHIAPFKKAIDNNVAALMVAHVYYQAFDDNKIPASLSENVINNYLKSKLNYEGLVISDDMDMGGITQHFNRLESCIKGINAGLDMFILRDSMDENLNLIDELENAVNLGLIQESRINNAVEKILKYKYQYKLFEKANYSQIDYAKEQSKIDQIAINSCCLLKHGNLLPLKPDNIVILSPDKSEIFNYSNDKAKVSDYAPYKTCKEIIFPLNPDDANIEKLLLKIKDASAIVFVSYNAILNPNQKKLYSMINKPKILIVSGIPYDTDELLDADSVLLSYGYKKPNIKAIVNALQSLNTL